MSWYIPASTFKKCVFGAMIFIQTCVYLKYPENLELAFQYICKQCQHLVMNRELKIQLYRKYLMLVNSDKTLYSTEVFTFLRVLLLENNKKHQFSYFLGLCPFFGSYSNFSTTLIFLPWLPMMPFNHVQVYGLYVCKNRK